MTGRFAQGATRLTIVRAVAAVTAFAALVAFAAPAAPLVAQPGASTCVPVAARPIQRGQTLAADDIAPRGATACTSRTSLVGFRTRRMIAAGEPLREPAIAAPDAIVAGQPVAVVWRDANVELRLAATALTAAPLGARATVRVADTRARTSRRLEGVAVAPGVVLVR